MRRWTKFATSFCIFTATGPAIGLILMIVQGLASGHSLSFSGAMVLLPLFGFFAYFKGIVPAFAAGIVFGAISAQIEFGRFPSIIIGFLSGFAMTLLWFLRGSLGLSGAIDWAVLGAISGACCGLITQLITSRPNNSFKRTAASKNE